MSKEIQYLNRRRYKSKNLLPRVNATKGQGRIVHTYVWVKANIFPRQPLQRRRVLHNPSCFLM